MSARMQKVLNELSQVTPLASSLATQRSQKSAKRTFNKNNAQTNQMLMRAGSENYHRRTPKRVDTFYVFAFVGGVEFMCPRGPPGANTSQKTSNKQSSECHKSGEAIHEIKHQVQFTAELISVDGPKKTALQWK